MTPLLLIFVWVSFIMAFFIIDCTLHKIANALERLAKEKEKE